MRIRKKFDQKDAKRQQGEYSYHTHEGPPNGSLGCGRLVANNLIVAGFGFLLCVEHIVRDLEHVVVVVDVVVVVVVRFVSVSGALG